METHGFVKSVSQTPIDNLVGYSTSRPSIFKVEQLRPVKDLQLLVRDYAPIAKNALTILLNLSDDKEILRRLATDDVFLESLMLRITSAQEDHGNEIGMLLANLAKSDEVKRVLTLPRAVPKDLSSSKNAMDQLMDCFVKGAEGRYNKKADYDYLAYFFADIAKFSEGRKYFVTEQAYDSVIPLSKLIVFTEHKSSIRRRGVASAIKNVCFDIPSHSLLFSSSSINLLPYILLPIMGPEEYPEEEMLAFPPDLQLLPPDKTRDDDATILLTHLETLLLLTTTRKGRALMRESNVYPIVRETHVHVEDEGVREACERLVQVLMRDEAGEGRDGEDGEEGKLAELEDDDEDKVVDVV
ncbi:MAG: hypothetical protein M1833_001190 [Piccolia ochrophora]|nr:MAG: hypothetical protein M1833_001190 [Piccolia ochrophora]